jgi:hypothetical protein
MHPAPLWGEKLDAPPQNPDIRMSVTFYLSSRTNTEPKQSACEESGARSKSPGTGEGRSF